MMAAHDDGASVAKRRRERRLPSWWRHERMSIACALAEALHHSFGAEPSTCGTRVVDGATNDAVRGKSTVTRAREAAGTEFFTFHDEEPAAGERPGPVEDPWPQERVRRHAVDQIVGTFVPVQILDDPVPLMVDQLVEVFKLLDNVVPEQVIDVPQISQGSIPQRSVDRDPQSVEQLVEVCQACSGRSSRFCPRTEFNGVFWGSGCIADDRGGELRCKGRGVF